jgi:hypothetical protein
MARHYCMAELLEMKLPCANREIGKSIPIKTINAFAVIKK